MQPKAIIFSLILLTSVLSFACGGVTPNTNGAANAANTADAKPPAADQNSAPTLTPVFKAYCEAMVKKDEAAIRKIYSAATIKAFEEDMKEENIKSLMKFLETDGVTGKICEVRNEVITGDKAVAEIRADAYPNGIKIEFVKEEGEWKLTNKSPAIDAVKRTDGNSAPPAATDTAPANK